MSCVCVIDFDHHVVCARGKGSMRCCVVVFDCVYVSAE